MSMREDELRDALKCLIDMRGASNFGVYPERVCDTISTCIGVIEEELFDE